MPSDGELGYCALALARNTVHSSAELVMCILPKVSLAVACTLCSVPTYSYCRHREGARVAVHVGIRKLACIEVVYLYPPVLIQHHLLGLDVVVHDGAARSLVKGLQPSSGVQGQGHLE